MRRRIDRNIARVIGAWMLFLTTASSSAQEAVPSEPTADEVELNRELRKITEEGRLDGRDEASNEKTVRRLLGLSEGFRDRDVPADKLAFLYYDAGRRSEKIRRLERAAEIFLEGWKRYPDTTHGGEHCARRYRKLSLVEGRPFPSLEGPSLSGEERITPDFSGARLTLVHFFEPAQEVCRRELERLVELRRRRAAGELALFVVALATERERVSEYLRERGVDLPVLADGLGIESPLTFLFAVEAVPWTFVVDRDGRIRDVGSRGERLADVVSRLLEEG